MPSVFITVPTYPNVPNLLGVPQLVRSALFPPTALPVLSPSEQGQVFASSQQTPVWGVFNPANNQKVIDADSVQSFDNRNEWKLADFPIQAGQFASYNKVIIPFENSLRFIKTGSLADRQLFLQQIANIAGDTNLYNIVTPEVTYLNVNVLRYEQVRRDQRDAFALWEVDVFFRQINQVNAQYSTTQVLGADTSNAQQPQAKPFINQGLTSATAPPAVATASATAAIAGAPM
jgi:hypothetical protein